MQRTDATTEHKPTEAYSSRCGRRMTRELECTPGDSSGEAEAENRARKVSGEFDGHRQGHRTDEMRRRDADAHGDCAGPRPRARDDAGVTRCA